MTKFSFHENLRMPAEWEKQKSTWIAWPHNKKDWPNKFDFIPEIFAEIISHISKGQKVNILIENNVLFISTGIILLTLVSFGLTKLFGPKFAILSVGLIIGTNMFGNVFTVIIPNQMNIISSSEKGEKFDMSYLWQQNKDQFTIIIQLF